MDGKKGDQSTDVSYAAAAAQPASKQAEKKDCADWYWNARKKLRFFPVKGATDADMAKELDTFVTDKLRLPSGVLSTRDIDYIRRVKSSKRSKISDELLVAFTSVEARDLVQSYARNLAEWTDPVTKKPTAGIRMEIPERLLGDFKALEQYGHAMKEKHGRHFKRHIKTDDSEMNLYLDVYLPAKEKWVRVDMEYVRDDNKKRRDRRGSSLGDAGELSTVDVDDGKKK